MSHGSEFLCGGCGTIFSACCTRKPGKEENGEDIEENLDEEIRPMRQAIIPRKPDASEVEDHRKSHLPYRSWCPWCVMGRGLGEQRGKHEGREHMIPRVGIDYWYITSKGLNKRDELEFKMDDDGNAKLQEARKSGAIVKCIIIRCHETKCVFAHVVPCKGADEDNYVVDLICSDIAWLGHARLLLKSDNEKALLSLVTRALRALKCQVEGLESVSSEQSQEYDSQANGGTEVGIRAVRGLFRTMRLCLEDRVGHKIPAGHPLTSWLVEHVALLLNAQVVGPDGQTAWARARGRPFGQKLYGFCENVLWKQPPKGPQHDTEGNMGPRLRPGVFMGYHRDSNSYRVATADGFIMKPRALQSRPQEDRWSAETIRNIVSTPWSLRTKAEGQRAEVGPSVEPQPATEPAPVPMPRRLKITQKILNEHGYTVNCEQCTHIQAFSESKPGLTHSEVCRKRIMESMAKSPEGAAKLGRYEERIDRALAERLCASDKKAQVKTTHDDDEGVRGGVDIPADEAHPAETPAWPEEMAAQMRARARTQREGTERRWEIERGGAPGYDGPRGMEEGDEDEAMEDARTEGNTPTSAPATAHEDQDDDMASLIQDLQCMEMIGSISHSCNTGGRRRDLRRGLRRMVSEIYSPPRVTKMLSAMPNRLLAPGLALDITCIDPDDGKPWDFDQKDKRDKALKMLRRQKPLFLIGSPMCTAWCAWQRLNAQKRDSAVVRRELIKAKVHLDFVMMLYREQVEGGRFFLHEHPRSASSWQERGVQEVQQLEGVDVITADQCQFGLEVMYGIHNGLPVRKPTGFMSNAPRLLQRLSKRCEGQGSECSRTKGGKHVTAQGRVARDAARYTPKLCRTIIKGMTDELRARGIVKNGEAGLHAVTDDSAAEETIRCVEQGYSGRYRDDITGQVLKDELVHEARQKELEYFHSKGVWTKRPKGEAKARTGKAAISVRWVDVNKGDDMNPRYRSRLVARQLKARDASKENFFAPTPPLEALRTVVSFAASTVGDWQPCYDPRSKRRMQVSFVDISRAYFNAEVDKDANTYVQLPPEDADHAECCAKLLRHMYGTRAAADGWQEEYSSFLVETLGFTQGVSSPCVFRHPSKMLVASVHGDDFTTAGACEDLDWFENSMSEHYECTIQPRIGPGPQDAKEGIVLNRVIRWTGEGLEYEADPRQAEKLIAECGLTGSNTMATPGVRPSFAEVEKDQPLEQRLHTAFRGSAARSNYLSADRIDCQFAAKEICRWMAKPTEQSWAAMKRLCRYLVGLPRMVYVYKFQQATGIEVYTDTDWAGCPRTRKSTSGGCVMLGGHLVKSWSSTQTSVALSSGEAEFNGVVRGSGIGLGYQSLLSDLGQKIPVRIWTDSSAAIGVCSRQGLGKLRHLDTHALWVQQALRAKRMKLCKIDGEVNPADLMTKHSLTREKLMQLTRLYSCEFRGGRAECAPQARKTPGGKVTMGEAYNLEDSEEVPIMPHVVYTEAQLEELYPPLQVPEAVDAQDPLNDDDDILVQSGNIIISDLIKATAVQGRKRRMKADE